MMGRTVPRSYSVSVACSGPVGVEGPQGVQGPLGESGPQGEWGKSEQLPEDVHVCTNCGKQVRIGTLSSKRCMYCGTKIT